MTAIWCGDPTWIAPNFGFLKMSNFNICVVHLGFGAILGDSKFGAIHVGSPPHVAVTGYTWLTLVINCNNEVCSRSNNTVSKAFWQNKVLPEHRISYCAGIYMLRIRYRRTCPQIPFGYCIKMLLVANLRNMRPRWHDSSNIFKGFTLHWSRLSVQCFRLLLCIGEDFYVLTFALVRTFTS